ncbi:MAG: HNH endonuclease domain-containing protein [Kiritimatiellae bacterium]|nr:HNH endonuclease domain-containing protein [Kiritimatiellia bacterium]
MARRLRFRRHLRRRLILKILIEQKMCPLAQEELKAWSQMGSFPKDNTAFVEWLKSTDTRNPYCDRARAATEKVDPLTLGRAIYHLAQRRGFKSGRKDQPEEGEEISAAKAKELGDIKGDIARISAELEKSGLTLGQYFFNEIKAGRKVRKQHTGRVEHYEKEWAKIAETQGLSKDLSDKIDKTLFWQRPLRKQSFLVGKCPLEPKRNRAQIGHPDFEEFRALSFVNNIRVIDGETRTPLTTEQRSVAAACFVTNERGKTRDKVFEFKVLGNVLRRTFPELKDAAFNYEGSVSLSPSKVTATLKEILPNGADLQKAFDALTFFKDEEELKKWAQLVKIQRKDKRGTPREPSQGLGLPPEAAERFAKIHIPEGRAGYSLHAIRKILPFLRKGVELSQAIFLAKLPDALRDFNENEDQFIAELAQINADYRKDKKNAEHEGLKPEQVPTLEERRRDWFAKKVKQDRNWKGDPFDTLYFRDPKADSSYTALNKDARDATEQGILPKVNLGMIRNPLVQRSMTMLRKLVNELRKNGTIDADTRIHIELARDVNSRNDRMAIQEWQKQNEKKRADAKAKLQEHGIANPAEDLVLKYVLWDEQPEHQCLYCTKTIGIADLLNESDIEHTLPRSRSGDDSQANKTVACVNCNRNIKKGLLPSKLPNHDEIMARLHPWLNKIDELKKLKEKQAKIAKSVSKESPDARSKARQKMLVTRLELKYWEAKYQRFSGVYLNEPKKGKPIDFGQSFISRQLVDTGIMTRHAVALLKTVYHDVYPVNGQAVAFARKLWKVQGEDETKDRSDHTHHAKDALVIAALSRERFQKICAELKADDERKNPKFNVAPPFAGFAQTVFNTTQGILVKHVTRHNEFKQTHYKSKRLSVLTKAKDGKPVTRKPAAGNTVRGQLHEETFYGKIKRPGHAEPVCVIRKALASCSEKDVAAIVDDVIRKCVQNKLAQLGSDFKKAIVQDVFAMASGVPIRKVRVFVTPHTSLNEIRRHTATPSMRDYKRPVYACTAAGSNLGIAVYKVPLRTHPEFVIEKLLDAVRHAVPPPPNNAELLGRILPGAMALARLECGELPPLSESGSALPHSKTLVYKVRKFDKNGITLWFHREARSKKDLEADLKAAQKNCSGSSSVDYEHPHEVLCLNLRKAWSSFLFEGIHFKMGLDGRIEYLTGVEK